MCIIFNRSDEILFYKYSCRYYYQDEGELFLNMKKTIKKIIK